VPSPLQPPFFWSGSRRPGGHPPPADPLAFLQVVRGTQTLCGTLQSADSGELRLGMDGSREPAASRLSEITNPQARETPAPSPLPRPAARCTLARVGREQPYHAPRSRPSRTQPSRPLARCCRSGADLVVGRGGRGGSTAALPFSVGRSYQLSYLADPATEVRPPAPRRDSEPATSAVTGRG